MKMQQNSSSRNVSLNITTLRNNNNNDLENTPINHNKSNDNILATEIASYEKFISLK